MTDSGFTFDASTGVAAGMTTERKKPNLDVSLDDIAKKQRAERNAERAKRNDGKRDKKRDNKKDNKKDDKKDKKKSDKKTTDKKDARGSKNWRELKVKPGILRQILTAAGVDAPADDYDLTLVVGRKSDMK